MQHYRKLKKTQENKQETTGNCRQLKKTTENNRKRTKYQETTDN